MTSSRKTVIAIENSTRPCPRFAGAAGLAASDTQRAPQLVTVIDRTLVADPPVLDTTSVTVQVPRVWYW